MVAFEAFEIIIERFLAIAEKNLYEAGSISVGFQPETSLSSPRTKDILIFFEYCKKNVRIAIHI